jgi:recombination protein RecT
MNRRQQQPDARQALAARRENGGADSQRSDLRKEIEKLQPEFQRAMPKGLEAGQLVRDALTVLRTSPGVVRCQPESIFGALMTCAQLGLRPNVPALGSAYIIPFKGQAQLVIGYKGYIDLAMRSPRCASVIARTVYPGDTWDVDYGLNEKLIHKPRGFRADGSFDLVEDVAERRGIAYYAIVRYSGGGAAFWTMDRNEVDYHRRRYAKSADSGPWKTEFDAMGRKTVVRQLTNYMPKSTEFADLLKGLQVDEGVRLNYAATADAAEVTQSTFTGATGDDVLEAESWENAAPAEPPADAAPPQVEEWPDVRQPAGES